MSAASGAAAPGGVARTSVFLFESLVDARVNIPDTLLFKAVRSAARRGGRARGKRRA